MSDDTGPCARTLWADAVARADLSTHVKGVALALWSFMDPAGWCWPGVTTLAERAGCSRRGAHGALAALEAAGLLERDVGGGRGRSSRYHALDPAQAGADRVIPIRAAAAPFERRNGARGAPLAAGARGVARERVHEVPKKGARGAPEPLHEPAADNRFARATNEDFAVSVDNSPLQRHLFVQLVELEGGDAEWAVTEGPPNDQGPPPAAVSHPVGARMRRTSMGPQPASPTGRNPLSSRATTMALRAREAAARRAAAGGGG